MNYKNFLFASKTDFEYVEINNFAGIKSFKKIIHYSDWNKQRNVKDDKLSSITGIGILYF